MTLDNVTRASSEIFARRRAEAVDRLGAGALVLPAAPIQYSSRDTERSYCADRELYYVTGVEEPDAVAVLTGGAEPLFVLFLRERDPDAELWAGERLGPERGGDVHAADATHPLSDLDTRLPDLLADADRVYFRGGASSAVDRIVAAALERARSRGPRSGTGPRGLIDPGEILDDLRLVKDSHELALIRQACEVTVDGHRAGAAAVRPGAGEWTVEAALEAAFRSSGARGPGFPTIVGSGPNACVLHYVENERVLGQDEVLLVDAGAEVGKYHGDVTRTYPVSGTFTPTQGAVYDVVEAARLAAVEEARPGSTIAAVHDAAVRVLTEGLVDLGVLEGPSDARVEDEAFKAYFPHQTSHWLGLDVHDPGDYAREGKARELEPGMVFTVEPGLYFRPDSLTDTAEALVGIGVRIEDDVAITEGGCEVLSGALPTAREEVEAMIGSPD